MAHETQLECLLWYQLGSNYLLFFSEAFLKQVKVKNLLTLLHSERPKLYTIFAFLSAIGIIVYNFGLSECNRVKVYKYTTTSMFSVNFMMGNKFRTSCLLL